jgi:uncharacterized membrane protein YfcA
MEYKLPPAGAAVPPASVPAEGSIRFSRIAPRRGGAHIALMTDFSAIHIAAVFTIFFVAGGVKGVTGMGLPTVAMGLLGATMPPVVAAGLLIVPSFVTNIWQLLAGPRFTALAVRLWPMLAGLFLTTIVCARLLTSIGGEGTTVALGVALMAYAGFALGARPLAVPPRLERVLSPLVGLTTGIVTGGTGVFVIPAVPYLQALGLDKDDLIQALGLSFTVSTVALAIGLAGGGAFAGDSVFASTFAVVPALLGMAAGQWARTRISAAAFRRWFLIGLLLLGLQLALRPFL